MERQLASVQKIVNLQPIQGADKIETAQVLGWQCVVKKGEFKVGDLCIYFEIDSQLPKHPVFDFMADRKYRVRTIKLRKQIAQGLALPLNVLNNFIDYDKVTKEYGGYYSRNPIEYLKMQFKEGDNVTELIGVTKYDPRPENADPTPRKRNNFVLDYLMNYFWFRQLYNKVMPRKTKGNFPVFINKTDETRLQSFPAVLRINAGREMYSTEKLDGSSATYFFNADLVGKKFGLFQIDKGNGFGVCSRNLRLVHPDNRYWWEYAKKADLDLKLREMAHYLGFSLAIQGELVGPNIQENKYQLNELAFFCFNIFNIDTQKYLPLDSKLSTLEKFEIPSVPLISRFVLTPEFDVNYFIELSKVKSNLNGKVLAEGLVCRSTENDAISFKVINPEWLLRYKE